MSVDLRSLWKSAGGSVPDHWGFKTIEELLEHSKSISVGVMYPGPNTEDGIPLIKVSDVKNGAVVSEPEFCVSYEVDEEYKRTRLNGTELLITLVGNPGDCVVVTNEMSGWNVARALAVVRLDDIQLRPWLRYVLLSKPAKHLIEARLNTTVQKTLNLKDIRELGLPIPPEDEREDITNVIDAIEDKMLLNRQTNQTLEQIAQAIFKSWFVDFEPVKAKIAAKLSDEDPELAAICAISGKTQEQLKDLDKITIKQLKTTAALFPDKLVESELGKIPEGWNVENIKSFSEVTDFVANGSFASLKENVTYLENGYAILIRLTDYNADWSGTFKFVDEHAYKFLKKSSISPMDIVISNVGANAGTVFRVPDLEQPMTLGPNSILVKSDLTRLYLFYHFTSHYGQHQLDGIKSGSAQPKFNKTDFRSLNLLKPTDNVLIVFNKQINIIENICFNNDKSCKKLAKLRDTLLPKLLSGSLEVEQVA